MATYKKYTSSITANISSSAHTNEEFKWYVGSSTQSTVYFGMEDNDNNFTGKLSNSSYTLSSDVSGCSATVSNIDSTKTAGIIYLNIPANTSTTNRTIVFKYNTVSLFTIIQSGSTTSVTTIIFSIGGFQGNNKVIIHWSGTNFSSDGTTVSCRINDSTPNSDGSYNARFTITIPSGYGQSYATCDGGYVYKGHKYSLVEPCTPSSYGNYRFKCNTTEVTYTDRMTGTITT